MHFAQGLPLRGRAARMRLGRRYSEGSAFIRSSIGTRLAEIPPNIRLRRASSKGPLRSAGISPGSSRACMALALAIWCATLVAVSFQIIRGHIRFDAFPWYSEAARNWWAQLPLYETKTIDGFLYFPQAAIAYSPFEWIGVPWGALLWRGFGWGLLCHALWRLSKCMSPDRPAPTFLIATCIAWAPSLGSLLCGQANLHIAAIMALTTLTLIEQKWWRAAAFLMLGLSLKPIMIVMVLMVVALYPPMRWRTSACLALFVLAPFLVGDFSYVTRQYRDCLTKLVISSQPDRLFEDLRGLLWTLGLRVRPSMLLGLRLFAAVGTLGLCRFARRRWSEPCASLVLLALTATFLTLFNPRTLPSSYMIVTPIAATSAAVFSLAREHRRRALWLIGVCMCSSFAFWTPRYTEFWLRPLGCAAFATLLVRANRQGRETSYRRG